MRKWKQKTAIFLSVTMAMASPLAVMAETTVGISSGRQKVIEVTFLGGDGGYWYSANHVELTTPSDAEEATSSNVIRLNAVEQEFPEASVMMDDFGCYYVTMGDSAESYDIEPVWEEVQNENPNFIFAGFYTSDNQYVGEYTPIYSDTTLQARWYNPNQIVDNMNVNPVIVGLKEGQSAAINPIAPEEEKTFEELEQIASEEGMILNGESFFAMDMDVSGDGNKEVTITMECPDALDDTEPIYVIHLKEDGVTEIIPTERTKGDLGTLLTFQASSFSPFYLVNVEKNDLMSAAARTALMVNVTVENVPGGIITVYTRDNFDTDYYYFPIGETVSIPIGTEIITDGTDYYTYIGDDVYNGGVASTKEIVIQPRLLNLTIKDANTSEVLLSKDSGVFGLSRTKYTVNSDIIISGTFGEDNASKIDTSYNNPDSTENYIQLKDVCVDTSQKLDGTDVEAAWMTYDLQNNKFIEQMTADTSELQLEVVESDPNGRFQFFVDGDLDTLDMKWDVFSFDDSGKLHSTIELPYGCYGIPYKWTYKGKSGYYKLILNVGRHVEFTTVLGTGEYIYQNDTYSRSFEEDEQAVVGADGFFLYNFDGSKTLSEIEEIITSTSNTESHNIKMALIHGYTRVGWETKDGRRIADDEQLMEISDDAGIEVFGVFEDAEGNQFEPAVVKQYGKEAVDPENPGGNEGEQPTIPGGSEEEKPTVPGGNEGEQPTVPGGSEEEKPQPPVEEDNKPSGSENSGTSSGSSSSGSSSGGSSGGSSRISSSNHPVMDGIWELNGTIWKFKKVSGTYATGEWGRINGQWYYFDPAGNMVTGWYQVNGTWYYMNPAAGSTQGVMMTGWLYDTDYQAWFYLNADGSMTTGKSWIDGQWYYFNPVSDGRMGEMLNDTQTA